jgi:DNA-directed RNA polymerase subunit omega
MLPSPDVLNDFLPGKFVLSNLAAKRAKQLREGAQPLVQIESNHPLTIALAEIAAGKIRAILPTNVDPIPSNIDIPMLVDDTMPGELGMLLPALDETEVALVSTESDDDSEHEVGDDDVISLSDLVADDEEEAAAVPSEDDTLSLSDIAEQESVEEDEPED